MNKACNNHNNSSDIKANVNICNEDGHKLCLKFLDSDIDCIVPISQGQYKILLDAINKNFIFKESDHPSEPPDDAEFGLLSGLRFMAPMDRMNIIYSAIDKEFRIIMINIDAVKEIMTIYKLDARKRVVSFDVPIGWLKNFGEKVDFGTIQIIDDGKVVDFGGLKMNSKDLISWFDRR